MSLSRDDQERTREDVDVLKILVSGCLGGRPIRFDASGVEVSSSIWERWVAEDRLVHFCPELAAGFSVPRLPAEIVGGTAADVVHPGSPARVLESSGRDVSAQFRQGADLAVDHARRTGVVLAVLVDGSPTCGSSQVYDGTFSGRRIPGRGLAAERLIRAGIPVFAQDQLSEAAALLDRLERP